MSGAPQPPPIPAPSPHPQRWAAEEQPQPIANPKGSANKRWYVYARIGRMGTGKASSKRIEEISTKLFGATEEECYMKQGLYINEYLHPKQRVRKAAEQVADDVEPSGSKGGCWRAKHQRLAAPTESLAVPRQAGGAQSGTRPGPGRGHTYQSTMPIETQFFPPLPNTVGENWLEQLSLRKKWQTERIKHLERQVEELLVVNATQARTIAALRERVRELEHLQRVAAEEIMSYIEMTPVLKEAAHAKRLEENPDWVLILGMGYTETQRRNLIYKHLAKLQAELRRITDGDPTKAKQLSDLLYLRVHAGEKRNSDGAAEHRRDVAEGIVASIHWFVRALHDAAGEGRYPQKARQAQQVIATAVSKAAALSQTRTTVAEIGKTLGLCSRMISKCQSRYDALSDGEWEQLFDDRSQERSDKMSKEWLDFAQTFWTDPFLADENGQAYNFVRRSERTSDEIRDPDNRKSAERFRIIWLEERINVMYEAMVKAGKRLFGDGFHCSWPRFLDLRPFYVKNATRETCMCVYHLRWREFADGLLTYRKTCRAQKVSNCSCSFPANEKALRKALVCNRREESQTLDNLDCMAQTCEDCKDLRKLTSTSGALSMCADEMRDPGSGLALKVKYESYSKITYTCKDGTEKVKKDFVSTESPFSEFKAKLLEYWPKFLQHHNDAKWLDDDFIALKTKLPRGRAALVIDFAENYAHKPRFEHQSKYFSQVQTTIVPVVVMMRVEDLTNISAEERSKLIALFDELTLPRVISETHYVVSSDMQHDNAMIRKIFDDCIIPYIQKVAPTVTALHVRSDGCKAQFKCAANFYWISRQRAEGCGLPIHWTFFESCHGKCYCDPEGGTLKNAARLFELHVTEREMQLKDSLTLFEWARDRSGLDSPKKSLSAQKGKGIYRRFFYWIPSKGAGAVDRSRLPKVEADGTSQLHEFNDIGLPGIVSTRRAVCNKCDHCWNDERHLCIHKDYVGPPKELVITHHTTPAAGAARAERAARARDGLARAEKARIGSVVCIETHADEQNQPWVIGKVVEPLQEATRASSPFDPNADAVRFDVIKVQDPVLKLEVVPARSTRVIDVELEAVRASSRLSAAYETRQRFKIDRDSLDLINAEMPAHNHTWEVESVLEYRVLYGVESWRVLWKGFGEDRCTWETWDNLLTQEVQEEARWVREAALPRTRAGMQKMTVLFLKVALQERGLETAGSKADLISRLLVALESA